jgi:glycosyltransferase involved in cell wall biosynthesis
VGNNLLFLWNYHYFPFEKGKSRFSDLLEAFGKKGYQVEVVTSSFYHMGKTQRSIEDPKYQNLGYKVHFIHEPGYKKNVSLSRVRSMNRFNAGVRAYLKKHDPVDVVYVPVPSIKLAAIAEKWCRITKAKCVIDVEDLWPESFRMIIKGSALYHAFTWPLKNQANKVYRNADAVVAVSQTYLDRVNKVRVGSYPSVVAPIGADTECVQSLLAQGAIRKPAGEFWISYIGTFGKSYDLRTVIDAVSALNQAYFSNIHLKLFGSGPEEEDLRRYAAKCGGNIDFMGMQPYEKMCQYLAVSDVGVNPIVGSSVASLINKVADYAACLLPVLNTQLCPEYQKMLEDCNAGLNVENGSSIALQKSILICLKNPEKVLAMKKGAKQLSLHYLSRAKSQSDILALIASIYGTESQK